MKVCVIKEVELADLDLSQCIVRPVTEPSEAWGAKEYTVSYDVLLDEVKHEGEYVELDDYWAGVIEDYLVEQYRSEAA
jgi:hypothetical protein